MAMKELANLHKEIINTYGYMVEVAAALAQWNGFLKKQMRSRHSMRQRRFFFGKGDPNEPEATYQHVRTWGDLVAASEKNGATFVVHYRNVLVLVVASWELYRKRIAHECNVEENGVTSDLFHDLNRARQAIVHGSGKLRDRPKVVPFLRQGAKVTLAGDQMDSIFRMVIDELNRIGTQYYGSHPHFSFDKQLSP